MEEKSFKSLHGQKITMDDRKYAQLTGVRDVISFDTEKIILESECGRITIKGRDLKVKKLTVEKQEIEIEGQVDSIVYSESTGMTQKGESVIGRLFR